MVIERARKRLDRKAKRGLRGWPVATVALYGPDDRRATKIAVGIVPTEGAEVTDLHRWLLEGLATSAPITALRRKCWPSSARREPSRLS